jgi:hypothetical protein
MPIPLLALVPIVISVAGRTFVTMAAKKVAKGLIKKGFKKLTKKNFKKSLEFFKGEDKISLADKNKVLKNLKIRIPKVDSKAAAEGAKLVKDITKPGKLKKLAEPFVKSPLRKALLPNPLKRPVHAAVVGGAVYGAHGMHKRSKEDDEKEEAAIKAKEKQDSEILEFKKESKIKRQATVEGTTLGEVDLNTLVDKKHTWKLDANEDFVVP